jgi:hypothetical protein
LDEIDGLEDRQGEGDEEEEEKGRKEECTGDERDFGVACQWPEFCPHGEERMPCLDVFSLCMSVIWILSTLVGCVLADIEYVVVLCSLHSFDLLQIRG